MLATLPAPTALLDLATVECDDASCTHALSHRDQCVCRCGGTGHGHAHTAGRAAAINSLRARIVRTGDVFLGAAADDDEPW